eukprot:XP_019923815.1 PREDICTED: uncharacterized protein LOC109619043 [Crassostrea gigas]
MGVDMLILLLLIFGLLCKTAALVVDDECVYTKNGEIQYAKFNETTQICCPRSGVHDKCQKEQEVQCCGDKIYRPNKEICCENKPYSSQHYRCSGNMVTSLTERCGSKRGRGIMRFTRHIWKSWLRKSRRGKSILMIILR